MVLERSCRPFLLGAIFIFCTVLNLKGMIVPIVNHLDRPIMVNIVPYNLIGSRKLYAVFINPSSEGFVGALDGFELYHVNVYDDHGSTLAEGFIPGPLSNIRHLGVYREGNAVKFSLSATSEHTQATTRQWRYDFPPAQQAMQQGMNQYAEGIIVGQELVPYYEGADKARPDQGQNANGIMVADRLVPYYNAMSTASQVGAVRHNQRDLVPSAKAYARCKGAVANKPLKANEDRWVIDESHPRYAIYGIFDGHDGVQVAEYCSLCMAPLILKKLASGASEARALTESFQEVDMAVCGRTAVKSGAVALVVLFDKLRRIIYTANVGNARALFINNNFIAEITIRPHLLGMKLPRFIGLRDTRARRAGVCISEPEVVVNHIDFKDGYLILVSEGVWNVLTNTDVAHTASHLFWPTPNRIAKELVKQAAAKGSRDDSTALVVKIISNF